MIITIKNLQQQTFAIEFDPAKTVLELKEEIFKERGDEYTSERQKLIYAGVILEDERSVASYNVDEKKFVVVMLKRGPAAAAAAATASASKTESPSARGEDDKATKSSSSSSAGTTTTTTAEVVKPAPAAEPTPKPTATNPANVEQQEPAVATAQAQASASDLLMGEDYRKSVDSMIEMGYSREMVERAMTASFNNPERAVEYLISGIPDAMDMEIDANAQEAGSEAVSQRVGTSNDPFEFLRDQPQFLQMRSLVSQNPDLLQAVLQQIGQTNPALLQLISDNQDAFLNMLNQPVEGQEGNNPQRLSSPERRSQINAAAAASGLSTGSSPAEQNTAGSERSPNQGRAAGGNEGATIIRLTRAERDAIERLKAMGFPEQLVVEAYIACDKNEELAANFLISSAFDD